MENHKIYGPHDKPPIQKWIPLSFQHVFAMFGATILVPLLTGLSTSTALFTAGTGTLLYILVTKAKVPAFLGSSFAFIPALIGIGQQYGVPYAMGGAICAGIFYCIVAAIVRITGKGWIDKALPPVVIGSVIIVIGISLAPTAIGEAFFTNQTTEVEKLAIQYKDANDNIQYIEMSESVKEAYISDPSNAEKTLAAAVNKDGTEQISEVKATKHTFKQTTSVYSLVALSIAAVTLFVAILATTFGKGFTATISILIGLLGGYFFTLIMGLFFPEYKFIDFTNVSNAKWFGLPFLQMAEDGSYFWMVPKFNIVAILTFVIISISTICEHLGDTLTTSTVVGQDFTKDPGLHRTLCGDGIATAWAAVWGGPPNTTYGENVGVMAITKVYSVWVIGGAAVIATILSFCPKFGALIGTLPTPVLGGICTLLYGMIAASGLRTIVEKGVDYKKKRNLTISSVILVLGIGGGLLQFKIGSDFTFQLGGVAFATVIGIILNLILPQEKESE